MVSKENMFYMKWTRENDGQGRRRMSQCITDMKCNNRLSRTRPPVTVSKQIITKITKWLALASMQTHADLDIWPFDLKWNGWQDLSCTVHLSYVPSKSVLIPILIRIQEPWIQIAIRFAIKIQSIGPWATATPHASKNFVEIRSCLNTLQNVSLCLIS